MLISENMNGKSESTLKVTRRIGQNGYQPLHFTRV